MDVILGIMILHILLLVSAPVVLVGICILPGYRLLDHEYMLYAILLYMLYT